MLLNIWRNFYEREKFLWLIKLIMMSSGGCSLTVKFKIKSTLTLLLLSKKVDSARLRESDIHPISLKTPAPQYQPTDRNKRKEKRVEDYSRDKAA